MYVVTSALHAVTHELVTNGDASKAGSITQSGDLWKVVLWRKRTRHVFAVQQIGTALYAVHLHADGSPDLFELGGIACPTAWMPALKTFCAECLFKFEGGRRLSALDQILSDD